MIALILELSGSLTGTQNGNSAGGIMVMDSYISLVATHDYPTLSTRPKPTPSHPNTNDISILTSDGGYI